MRGELDNLSFSMLYNELVAADEEIEVVERQRSQDEISISYLNNLNKLRKQVLDAMDRKGYRDFVVSYRMFGRVI